MLLLSAFFKSKPNYLETFTYISDRVKGVIVNIVETILEQKEHLYMKNKIFHSVLESKDYYISNCSDKQLYSDTCDLHNDK